LANPLQILLDLSESAKDSKGLKYTPREIFQQPDTWKDTYSYCLDREAAIRAFLESAGIWSGSISPIVLLVGAGSSDYIGRALVHLLRRHWRCEVSTVPSTDLLLDMDSYLLPGREYLWISFSRSGDSSEGVAVLKSALRSYPQVRHLVVTCNAEAAMARLCAEHRGRALPLVLGEAVNDRGLAMTSSFSNMVIVGQCLAHIQDLHTYGETVSCVARLGTGLVASASEVAFAIAERELPRACFVGSGALAAVADEAALKLLELTGGKVHTMSQSTLGLRHGPMSGINENTLFVQFLSSDPRHRRYEMDLLEEIGKKNLAGARLVVTGQNFENLAPWAEYVLCLDAPPDFQDDCRPPLDVIVGQLLGLFASLRAGLQPDNPSPNGAISRVVSGIRFHS
jgi:tagatose-6-phosphate ketose/aldose isomerase